VYTIPEIRDRFVLYEVKALPFPLQRNLWGNLKVDIELVAVDARGRSFEYDARLCRGIGSSAICSPEVLEVHCKPVICSEELVVRKTIGSVCVKDMEIFVPVRQGYLHQSVSGLVSIYSPVNDTVRIVCASVSSAVVQDIGSGITVLKLPSGCVAESSELTIFSASDSVFEGEVPLIFNADLSREVYNLTSFIEYVHDLNMSKIEIDFDKYSVSVNDTGIDLSEVKESLAKFKHISSLKQYNPMKIDWEDPYALTNVTTVSGVLVTILLIVVIVYVCCRCCACCAPCWKLCKCTSKICGGGVQCCTERIVLEPRSSDTRPQRREDTENLELSQNNNDEVVWEMEDIGDRLVLYARLRSGNIYYNSVLNVVENSEGYVLKGVLPPVDKVNEYWLKFDTISEPKLRKDHVSGKYCIVDQVDVLYDADSDEYVHRETGKVMYGFRKPKGKSFHPWHVVAQ
jgi:hypothetical protein